MVKRLIDKTEPFHDFIVLSVIVGAMLAVFLGAIVSVAISHSVGMAIMIGTLSLIIGVIVIVCFIGMGHLLVVTWREGKERARKNER